MVRRYGSLILVELRARGAAVVAAADQKQSACFLEQDALRGFGQFQNRVRRSLKAGAVSMRRIEV
jgi:hypothetical protein